MGIYHQATIILLVSPRTAATNQANCIPNVQGKNPSEPKFYPKQKSNTTTGSVSSFGTIYVLILSSKNDPHPFTRLVEIVTRHRTTSQNVQLTMPLPAHLEYGLCFTTRSLDQPRSKLQIRSLIIKLGQIRFLFFAYFQIGVWLDFCHKSTT